MAVLQYIGARYVPKFYENPDDQSNDWKAGQVYEPLTIVTYNNDSYTSKKEVQDTVGDPASNPDYWALTGQYNASIIAINNTIAQMQTEIDAKINLFYTPDMFGTAINTDAEKVQMAFDALENTGGTILLDREYLIDQDIIIRHHGNGSQELTPIYVLGGKEGVFKIDGGIFKGSALRRGGVKFTNVTFRGTDYTSDKVFAGDDTLRRIWCQNCKFEDFDTLTDNSNTEINANVWSFDGCTFHNFHTSVFTVVTSAIIVRFLNCVLQQGDGDGFDFSNVSGGVTNFDIRDCVITQYNSGAGIKFGNNNISVNVSGCDFEANNVHVDLTACTANTVQEIVLNENYFTGATLACIYLPQACAANSFIEKERIIPVRIVNSRFNRSSNDFVFINTPLVYHKLYFDIPAAPENIQDYLHLYGWKNKLYATSFTNSDSPGTTKDIVDWATFLAATGRSQIDEFYIAGQSGTMASPWFDVEDQKFKCRLQVTPSGTVTNSYQIFWKN